VQWRGFTMENDTWKREEDLENQRIWYYAGKCFSTKTSNLIRFLSI